MCFPIDSSDILIFLYRARLRENQMSKRTKIQGGENELFNMPSNSTCHININKAKALLSCVIWFALVREPSFLETEFLLWENEVQDITGRS